MHDLHEPQALYGRADRSWRIKIFNGRLVPHAQTLQLRKGYNKVMIAFSVKTGRSEENRTTISRVTVALQGTSHGLIRPEKESSAGGKQHVAGDGDLQQRGFLFRCIRRWSCPALTKSPRHRCSKRPKSPRATVVPGYSMLHPISFPFYVHGVMS